MNKINWLVRFKNPVFLAQLALAVLTPIMGYYGLTGADFTTWAAVWNTFVAAVSNPYVVVMVLVSVWNAVNDPTTSGVTDSTIALGYKQPNKE